MKKIKVLIMIGVILSTILASSIAGACAEGDIPRPSIIAARTCANVDVPRPPQCISIGR